MTSLKNHMRLKCHEKQHQCDVCEKWFNNYSVMVVHKRVHFGERPYKCLDCGDRFNCISSLKTHYKMHKLQNEINYASYQFVDKFPSCQEYQQSLEQTSDKFNGFVETYNDCSTYSLKPNYTSLYVGGNYIKYGGLNMNLLRKTDLKRHQCKDYKKSFKCKLMKDFHKQLHHQPLADKNHRFLLDNRFPCQHCEQNFADDKTLQNHKKRNHFDRLVKKKFPCTKCHFSSDNKTDFKGHCVTHIGVKSYKCDTCGKCYSTKGNLTKHIKSIHIKDNEYKCDYCEKFFFRRGDLLKHVKIVHDKIKSFVCNQCHKIFSQCCNLKKHIRTHTKEKPFQCLVCNKSFSVNSTLKNHMRTHTKEKPFQCSFCNKRFTQSGTLTKHLRIHTNEKLFQCTFCDKKFSRNDTLKAHNRTHTK